MWYINVVEAQGQLAAAVEKERFASEKLMESSMRLSSLESQISSLRQERSRLLAELDVERTKVELAEEAKHKLVTKVMGTYFISFISVIFSFMFTSYHFSITYFCLIYGSLCPLYIKWAKVHTS